MLLRKTLALLLFLTASYLGGTAQTVPYPDKIRSLYSLSLNNINVGSHPANDSIIALCRELEPLARAKGDKLNTFMIGQIFVNASCQQGDIGFAITKTKQMYEEAEKRSSSVGMAIALQAFGSTYLHSGQYREAYTSFAEAEQEAAACPEEMHVRLTFQQLYTCLALHTVEDANRYLNKLNEYPSIQTNPLLSSQVLYLRAALSLVERDLPATLEHINQVEVRYGHPKELWMLYQMIISQYYMAASDYTRVLPILDSLLVASGQAGNNVGHRNVLWLKARVLALSEAYDPACNLYEEVRTLSDAINIHRYISSIDTLRVSYRTNQMKLENISSYNRLTIQSIILVCLFGIGGTLFFVLLKRKNRKLRESKAQLSAITEATTRSIQTKSLFLSNMSHDLRTPLNAIVGFSNLLADKEEIDQETKGMCGEYIRQNSDLLLKLFNDILDLSALNENKMHFRFEACNVTTLCRNVTDSVIRSLKDSDNTLLFEPRLGDLVINTDNGRLQQVLINLMVNATKFTHGGTIRLILEVDEQKQEAIFTVEDTGCGILLEKQPGIFERFEKLHEKKQGAGLGLSICKLIVDRLGGKIWIDPEYTRGARFIFTHPLHLKEETC